MPSSGLRRATHIRGGAHNVDDRIDGADLMEMDRLQGDLVNCRFCLAEQLKGAAGTLFRVRRQMCGSDDTQDRR